MEKNTTPRGIVKINPYELSGQTPAAGGRLVAEPMSADRLFYVALQTQSAFPVVHHQHVFLF
jgi:hypothetical protein